MKEHLKKFLEQIVSLLRSIPVIAMLPALLFIIFAGLVGVTITRSQNVANKEIYATLATIKFIEETPIGPQEINFTDKTINIFGQSANSQRGIFVTTRDLVEQIKIEEVVFPPIRKERLKIVDKDNKGFVENYFHAVYNLLSDLNTNEDLNQLTLRAIDGKPNQIQYELDKTKRIYREMYRLDVPQKADRLHVSYLRVIQTQFNLYQNIAKIGEDPARLRIDLIVTQEILQKLQEEINTQLTEVSETYGIEIERSNQPQ